MQIDYGLKAAAARKFPSKKYTALPREGGI
jgi:hypothetical protein